MPRGTKCLANSKIFSISTIVLQLVGFLELFQSTTYHLGAPYFLMKIALDAKTSSSGEPPGFLFWAENFIYRVHYVENVETLCQCFIRTRSFTQIVDDFILYYIIGNKYWIPLCRACCTCFLLALQKGSCFIVIKLLYLILLVALICNSNLETAG